MKLFAFAYHALRSAGWWLRSWLYGLAVWCGLDLSGDCRLGWGYAEGVARVCWQSARRELGRPEC